MRRLLFWLLVGITVAVYLAMVTWSLPLIQAAAGGLMPFDMRPTGYGFEEARAFLAALTPEGADFYRSTQHLLDLFFPGLIAATLYFAIAALLERWLGGSRWLAALPVVLVALFDWLENAAVSTMLAAGADGVTPDMVAAASRWTLLKSIASTAAYTLVLVLLLIGGWHRLRRGARRAQP